ncbi:hypothetical protein QBC32DRAFT_328715 [Pseudoneurospora amorphoporcata]|uniref:Uncharacterized protein n=1 Tax=Pseudoneurospora amorphoporcata TaxID=241081 RepID=A0AAN6NLW7_9PEZI|nr:hypothetical protein QBC32DRAFT_328715 [Pseudoneurospora amorphoporcata]
MRDDLMEEMRREIKEELMAELRWEMVAEVKTELFKDMVQAIMRATYGDSGGKSWTEAETTEPKLWVRVSETEQNLNAWHQPYECLAASGRETHLGQTLSHWHNLPEPLSRHQANRANPGTADGAEHHHEVPLISRGERAPLGVW